MRSRWPRARDEYHVPSAPIFRATVASLSSCRARASRCSAVALPTASSQASRVVSRTWRVVSQVSREEGTQAALKKCGARACGAGLASTSLLCAADGVTITSSRNPRKAPAFWGFALSGARGQLGRWWGCLRIHSFSTPGSVHGASVQLDERTEAPPAQHTTDPRRTPCAPHRRCGFHSTDSRARGASSRSSSKPRAHRMTNPNAHHRQHHRPRALSSTQPPRSHEKA